MSENKRSIVLPYELEREIFELTARAFPGHAVKLCTLSSYVQKWMEVIIYEIVVLDFPLTTTKLFLETFYTRPASFFGKNVKQLYLTTMVDFPEARQIISACTGATNVVCWADPLSSQENIIQLLPIQQLQCLSIKLDALWGKYSQSRQFTPSLFPNLSHLEIVSPPSSRATMQIDWEGIRMLPRLTHLAVGHLWSTFHQHYLSCFQQILDECQNLKVLLLITNDNTFMGAFNKSDVQRDPRVIAKEEFNGSTPLPDYWDGIRQGGPDFWSSADESVLERSLTTVS